MSETSSNCWRTDPQVGVLNACRHHRGGSKARGKRQKAKVGNGCSTPVGISEVGICTFYLLPFTFPFLPFRVLNACRHHRGGQKAKGKSGKWVLIAFRLHRGGIFCLLPFAFQGVASVRKPKSKIENPKSCVGPVAIQTGSRTRPSDRGSNARFGPVEDRRNNRRLATFTCASVLLTWEVLFFEQDCQTGQD